MPLTNGEIEELKENRFHVDLLEMRLTRRGDVEDVYSGSGFIQQDAGGDLEFRLYDRTRQHTVNFGSFIPGSFVEDEQYYDLEARDISSRTWRASHVIVFDSGAIDVAGCICKGELRQVTCFAETAAEDGLWMYLPGEVKLPTNAITRIVEETPGRMSIRPNFNLWEVKGERFELLMTKVEGGLEVDGSYLGGPPPEHFEQRLEEALWFTLAFPAKWTLLDIRKGGEHSFIIRRLRDKPGKPLLRPPLEPELGAQADHLGRMFVLYLDYILRDAQPPYYHPTSVTVYQALRGSALSLNAEAWQLSVAVESLARSGFPELGRPSADELIAFDEAVKYVEGWTGDEGVKGRIVRAISTWRGSNPREVLKQLTKKGVVTEHQVKAWNTLRHRIAHGRELLDVLDELPALCDSVYMAFLRMMFDVIGYSGPYTDRSSRGWPQVHYEVKGRTMIDGGEPAK
jgi:hypothetical protein